MSKKGRDGMVFQKTVRGFIFALVVGGALVTEAGKGGGGDAGGAAAIRGTEIEPLYRQAVHDGNKELQYLYLTEWEGALMEKIRSVYRGRTLQFLTRGEQYSVQKYVKRLANVAVKMKELGRQDLAEIYAGNARHLAVDLSSTNTILRKAHL